MTFGWVKKKGGHRRFRESYWEVPRKNGKSVVAGGVGISMFVADGEFGAEVYAGATTEKQAWEVFRPAKLMVSKSPMLVEAAGIEVNASNMNIPADFSRFEPLIGNPGDNARKGNRFGGSAFSKSAYRLHLMTQCSPKCVVPAPGLLEIW